MDIDKLYLTTYYFQNKDGHMTNEFDESSKENLSNKLLDNYLTLLEDGGRQVNKGEITKARYTQYLRRSIDNDTTLVDDVLAKIRANDRQSIYESMQYGSLNVQTNIKDQFITGKKGIGPFALNNNSQILTQMFNVSFAKKDGLLGNLGLNSLHNYIDRDGNSIQSWLSAMINIHVDVAKDPKVRPLNINQYTYNLLNLLLRIGLGQDSLYFITQPVIRELAEVSNQNDGYIVENPGLSKSQRQKRAEADLLYNTHFQNADLKLAIDMLNRNYLSSDIRPKLNGRKYKDIVDTIFRQYMPLIRSIFSIDENGKYRRGFEKLVDGKWQYVDGTSIFEDVMTSTDVLIDPNGSRSVSNLKIQPMYKIGSTIVSPNDVQGLVYIAKVQLDGYAQALSNVVKYTKIDTKKQGKNIDEQVKYREEYSHLRETRGDGYFDSNLITMLDDSFINEKTKIGTRMLQDILSSEVIHATPMFKRTVDKIADAVNQHSDASLSAIRKGVMAAIKQICVHNAIGMDPKGWKSMITGPNTLSIRIQELRAKMLANPEKYSDFVTNGNISNRLLDAIRPVPYTPSYGSERYDIITLDNIESDDMNTENDYIDAWQQLLDSEDKEIHDVGYDLAVYAFMTSADTTGSTKFFKYVPVSWRIQTGYDDQMRNAYEEYAHPEQYPDKVYSIDPFTFLQDNWLNNSIVPVTQQMIARPATQEEIANGYTNTGTIYEQNFVSVDLKYKDINKAPGHSGEFVEQHVPFMIAGVKFGYNYARTTISANSEGEFPLCIKIRRRGAAYQDTDSYLLYRLAKVAKRTVVGKDGKSRDIQYPIYILTVPSGARVYALGQTFQFYGYDRGSEYSHLPEIKYPSEQDFLDLEQFLNLNPLNPDQIDDIKSYSSWLEDIVNNKNSNFVGDAAQVIRDVKDEYENEINIQESANNSDEIPFYTENISDEDARQIENSARRMLDDAEFGDKYKERIKNIFGTETPYREEPYKASELLQNMINTTKYSSIKKIAEMLLALSTGNNDFNVYVHEHMGQNNASGEAYQQDSNKANSYVNIYYLTGAFVTAPEHVILHELSHLNTLALMRSDKHLYDAIQQYSQYVKQNMTAEQRSEFSYAFNDPLEFVAELYSRPRLQSALKSIPAMDRNKFSNIFEQVIDAIKQAVQRLLGIEKYPDNAFDQIMPVINQIISTQYSMDANVSAQTASDISYKMNNINMLSNSLNHEDYAIASELSQIIYNNNDVDDGQLAMEYAELQSIPNDIQPEMSISNDDYSTVRRIIDRQFGVSNSLTISSDPHGGFYIKKGSGKFNDNDVTRLANEVISKLGGRYESTGKQSKYGRITFRPVKSTNNPFNENYVVKDVDYSYDEWTDADDEMFKNYLNDSSTWEDAAKKHGC